MILLSYWGLIFCCKTSTLPVQRTLLRTNWRSCNGITLRSTHGECFHVLYRGEAGKRKQIALFQQKICSGWHFSHSTRHSICWSLFNNVEWSPPINQLHDENSNQQQATLRWNGNLNERKPASNTRLQKNNKQNLLLHYQSHVDSKDKRSLLETMLIHIHCLSSSQDIFADECNNLKSMFLKLK